MAAGRLAEQGQSKQMTDFETNRQTITVTPAVFDALRNAGLLVKDEPARRDWPTYGTETEDGSMVICTMIAGEHFYDTTETA